MISQIFSARTFPTLLCLVVPSPSGYAASYLKVLYSHCHSQGKMMMIKAKTKTSVCPCVEVKSCTPSYSLFALNDQRRTMRDQCVMYAKLRQNNTRQSRSYSELCPYVCDICCTCMYFKSFKKMQIILPCWYVSRAAILYLLKGTFHCSPKFIKMYQLSRNEKYIKIYRYYIV